MISRRDEELANRPVFFLVPLWNGVSLTSQQVAGILSIMEIVN
jgi:hypothetical protein